MIFYNYKYFRFNFEHFFLSALSNDAHPFHQTAHGLARTYERTYELCNDAIRK